MSRIGFAAIGVGGRLTGLVRDLLATHSDKVHLTALCDNSPEALAIAQKQLGFEGTTTVDADEAIATTGTEWVLIGSRNDLHAQQCMKAFAAGKHVFCEKPLATSEGDAPTLCLVIGVRLIDPEGQGVDDRGTGLAERLINQH
jgi:predicted dehydrogenase